MADILRSLRTATLDGSAGRIFSVTLVTLGLLFMGISDAHATHAMGGDLTYECLGNNQYKVTLNFFRDCNGVEAPTNCNNGRRFRVRSSQCIADFNACFALESVEVITPICDGAADRCTDPNGQYGVERYKFSATINLSQWAGCGTDWLIEWELCCRNNAITSLNNPGARNLYLSARLNNTVVPCNSSPRFLNHPVPFGCVGQPMVYNHGVSDLAGDSLTFELAPARGNNGNSIPYNAGYTYLQPVITSGGANAVQIDPATGTISFVPSIQQFAVVSVLVKEFRNGVQIGSYIRDVQFAIIACNNNNPTLSGINGTNTFVQNVCAGESICFNVNSFDADPSQVVTMTWNNAIPGATFTTAGSPHPTGTFCWTPTAANIGSQIFTVSVEDDACVLNGFATQGYVINITPPFTPANAGPDQNVCGPGATLAGVLPYPGVQGTWSVVSGSGVFTSPNSPTTTVTGLGPGQNVFQWAVDYQTCGIATDQVVITSFDPAQPAANAGPAQMLCTPNNQTTLNANVAVPPAVGTWTVLGGTGVFADPNSPTTLVTGLSIGQNTFRWTINNGPCGTPTQSSVTVMVYDYALPAANAGPDQSFCSIPASVQLGAQPNNGVWSVVAGSGVFADPTNRNTTVTGLSLGVNTFQWTIYNGPCDPPTTMDQVNIMVYDPNSPAADAGSAQQVCSATASLAGSTPTPPATGTWTLIGGAGTITTPNAPNTTVSGLGFGNNVFQWTVNNGPCGSTNSQVTITRFNSTAAAANAGPDQSLCTVGNTGLATTTLAGNVPATPATGTWTVITGTAVFANPNSATTSVSGLSVGVNTLRWTIDNGPCTPPTTFDDVVITVFDRNAPAANAGADQDLCAPIASIQLAAATPAAPATGQWSVISGGGTFTDASSPNTTVNNPPIGTNVYRWTVTNGPCPGSTTTDDVVIRVFDPGMAAANAGPDQELCASGSTTLAGSPVIAPGTGQWTIVSGTATISAPSSPTSGVSGIPVGVTVLRWTVDNGPCGTSFDDVTIIRYSNATLAADAGEDISICLPVAPNSITLDGSAVIAPAIGTWTLVSGSATIVSPNSPGTVVSGLTVGIHEFLWTVNNGSCGNGITSDLVRVYVHNASIPPADAGDDISLCEESGTTSMAAIEPPVPATGTWTLVSGTGTIEDPDDPQTNVTGLAIGHNILQWTQDNGPCGSTTDQVSIFVYDPEHPSADAGPDQGICTDSGNAITLNGSPVTFPATGTWTFTGGPATILDPNSPNTSVTDLISAVYVFTWTIDNGVCPDPLSSNTTQVVVANGEAQPADAGMDRAICNTEVEVLLEANEPEFPAFGYWTVVQGTADFDDVNSAITLVTGLSVGVNILQWNIDNLECGITTDQVTIVVFSDEQPEADAGPDQFLCTPATSTGLQGSLLIGPAMGQWTLVSGAGTIADPTSPTSTVSGLGLGENVFQWQVNNGACGTITSDQVSIFMYDLQAPAANAGPDQQICAPASSVVMAATPPTNSATGAWSLISGAGGVVTNPSSATTTINGLPVGTHVYEWTLDNGACGISSDQVIIQVFDSAAPDADAGVDQHLCLPQTSTTLMGSTVIAPATGQWSLVSGTGSIADPADPNTALSGLGVGENIFEWVVDNGPCPNGITSSQVSIFVYDDQQAEADAGPDQEYCTPTSTATLTGSPVIFPATGSWELVSGSGTIVSTGAQVTEVTGLQVGINIFSYTIDNGPCAGGVTTDQMQILIFDEDQPEADAGADQFLCAETSTNLSGNAAIVPAQGTWTLISGSGTITDPNDPNSEVTGLELGENIFQWTISNGPCANSITADVVSIFVYDEDQPAADAGVDQQLCSVDVASLQGSAVIFPATGTWTLVSGSGSISDPNDPNTTVTGLGFGDNVFAWTVDNGPCASGITSDQVTITRFDGNNPNPVAGPDQSLCTPATSTSLQATSVNFPAEGTWTVLAGAGVFADENDPTTTVSGLEVGENVFLWTVFNGVCETGGGFDMVSIFLYDENNLVADAGPDQQLCTSDVATTTMAGSSVIFPAAGTWTLVSGTGMIVDPNDPNTTVLDLGIGNNVFQWQVDNGPCADGITSDLVTIAVFDEEQEAADAGPDQDLCTPVPFIQLAGSPVTTPSIGTWTIISGSGTLSDPNDPQATITGATPGTIILEWSVDNGPCGTGVTTDELVIQLFDENNPVADAGPDQQRCTPATTTTMQGSALIAPATGTWVLLSGSVNIVDPNDPNTEITDAQVGVNVLQWVVDNGPCAAPTNDQVSIIVFDAENLDADAGPDQQVCTPLTNAIMAGSTVTFPAVGTWTLISGAGDITDANDPSTNITGLGIGMNVFEWTVDNGVCANGITSDQVTITLFDANAPPADAGADQQLCAPDDEVVLSGNAPVGSAVGTWTLVSGIGTIADPNDPNTAITGMEVGENIFAWTLESGECATTSDQVSIFIFDPDSPDAFAGLDQELCVPQDSVFMGANTPIFPAYGVWSLLSGTGTLADPNDPNSLVTGLTVGQHVFMWEVFNGPCENGITNDVVTVTVYDDETAPANAGPDLQTCIPINFMQLQGEMPPAPAVGTWTVIAGTGDFADPNDATTMVTGLSQGINTFVWTLEWDPCPNNGIVSDTVDVYVYDPFAPIADAGPDEAICGPGVNTSLHGNIPEEPGVGTWTVLGGDAVVLSPNDPFSGVENLTVGVHTLLWTIYNGQCGFGPPSTDTLLITVYDSEAPPALAGEDIEACTPVNSATLQASAPVFPATGVWATLSTDATMVDPNDPNTDVISISVGEHQFTWTIDNGPCGITSDDVSIFLYQGDLVADAGEDQLLCTPNTSTTLTANDVPLPAIGTWTLVSGSGTITDPNSASTTVSDLGVGVNVFQWSITNGSCGDSSDQVSIIVYDQDHPVANAGADQEHCAPATSITLQGSPVTAPATGMWTLVSGSGIISDPTSPATTITGVGVGTIVLEWTVDNGPCDNSTSDQVAIFIYDGSTQPAAAGPDQAFCAPPTPADVTMLANMPQAPATGSWTVTSGSATVADPSDPFTAVDGLAFGQHVFTWTIDNGACGTTSDDVVIGVFDANAGAANAGPDQEHCQDVSSVQMAAFPAESTSTGIWTMLTGNIEEPMQHDTWVNGLTPGHHYLVWTITNGPFEPGAPCGPTADTMLVYIKDCLTLRIPDAFSPNGDGVNDLFVIENILSYPKNSFQVFNRWGNKVFDQSPYVNDWDGTSQFGAVFGEKLPESTYYYVLDLGDGMDKYTGSIFLRR